MTVESSGNRAYRETTRYLCASAFLLNDSFRRQIRRELRHDNRAAAPDSGLDLKLLSAVVEFADARAFFKDLVLGVGGLVALCLLAASVRNFGLALVYYLLVPFTGGESPEPLPFSVLAIFIAIGIGSYKFRFDTVYGNALRYFGKTTFDPQSASFASDGEIESARNVVVYSGFSPFVGAGANIGGWSFVVDTTRSNQEPEITSPRPFELMELYEYVDSRLQQVRVPSLLAEDWLFVNGRDVRSTVGFFDDGQPVGCVSRDVIEHYKTTNNQRVRYYRWMRVVDWGGELAVSYLLRFSKCGDMLFVEGSRLCLLPLDARYKSVDGERPWKYGAMAVGILWRVIAAPVLTGHSLAMLALRIYHDKIDRKHSMETARERSEDPMYDYGVRTSVRESFASREFAHYFQKLDQEMYLKLLEKQIFDSIVTFLNARKIDTSDLRSQQSVIINSGVIVHGGLTADVLAVGKKAKAFAGAKASRTQAEGVM